MTSEADFSQKMRVDFKINEQESNSRVGNFPPFRSQIIIDVLNVQITW